jgi:hypothetical protein
MLRSFTIAARAAPFGISCRTAALRLAPARCGPLDVQATAPKVALVTGTRAFSSAPLSPHLSPAAKKQKADYLLRHPVYTPEEFEKFSVRARGDVATR